MRIEKKKGNRQHYNIIPGSAEAESGVFFSSLLLYHSKYMQIIRSVLGQGPNKEIKKCSYSLFLGAHQDGEDKRNATHSLVEFTLDFVLSQT